MNMDRRSKIADLKNELEAIRDQIESLQGDEQAAYDNLPESLQGADKGQAMEAAAEALQSAFDSVDEAVGYLDAAAE